MDHDDNRFIKFGINRELEVYNAFWSDEVTIFARWMKAGFGCE